MIIQMDEVRKAMTYRKNAMEVVGAYRISLIKRNFCVILLDYNVEFKDHQWF